MFENAGVEFPVCLLWPGVELNPVHLNSQTHMNSPMVCQPWQPWTGEGRVLGLGGGGGDLLVVFVCGRMR